MTVRAERAPDDVVSPSSYAAVHAVPPAPAAQKGPRAAGQARSVREIAADLLVLTKPRITGMVVATMLGGAWVASRSGHAQGASGTPASQLVLSLVGTVLVVSGANALNMYIERDSDRLMARTRDRPLPAGRLAPEIALWFGVAISVVALVTIFAFVNVTTGALAAFALLSYVLAYTPLKRKTTLALPIGAVPGAIPPLLGWTTVTGRIDAPGLALFGILFLWQLPHFLAIATFRGPDYKRAGLKVLPVERGDAVTRRRIVLQLVALVAVSVSLVPLGVAGPVYLGAALLLGLGFLGVGVYGLRPAAGARWARTLFATSIVYLALLLVALMVGA